jgi:hypothetical protein
MRGDSMTNTEAQTQHFIILQKIKQLGFVEGKTLTEIADKLGTTRQNIGSIKTKIEAHKDCIEGNFKSHYKKINLKKYKDYYVFSVPNFYVICYKKSDIFKKLMGI